MCGILGFNFITSDEKSTYRVLQTLRHRGPDDLGLYQQDNPALTLGMTRLAVVDLHGGAQPMTSQNGQLTIVFNGEIFNAPELRRWLLGKGVRFRSSHSDTEVLLYMYQRLGTKMLNQLNGMFAFAIYDRAQNNLVVARDRLGIKPLYYAKSSDYFCFSSEIRPIRQLKVASNTLDPIAVQDYLTFQFVPSPLTIFRDIRQLEPGGFLKFELSSKSLSKSSYWSPADSIGKTKIHRDIRDQTSELLNCAVKRWSVSDVPIACSLSGGLDSSAIVGISALSDSGPVSTFTLGFESESAVDESREALELAKYFGCNHSEIRISPKQLLAELPHMVSTLEQPYAGGLPSWFVFKQMSLSHKVALTGIGGDEIFGNYGKWSKARFFYRHLRQGGSQLSELSRFTIPPIKEVSHVYFPHTFSQALTKDLLREINQEDYTPMGRIDSVAAPFGGDWALSCLVIDLQFQLPDEFLFMTDRFSMNFSIEARTPFLDNELVDFALSLPSRKRTNAIDTKRLLRRSLANSIPSRFLHRPKRGFVLPLADWLRGPLKSESRAFATKTFIENQGIFNYPSIESFLSNTRPLTKRDTNQLWTWFMFQKWWAESGSEKVN